MKRITTILICMLLAGCHMCIDYPQDIELGSTSFSSSPVQFSAAFECPQNPNSLLFVVRGMKDNPETYCQHPDWKIDGFCSISNLTKGIRARMPISQTNVVLGNWNHPDTTAILSFEQNIHSILSQGDKCKIEVTLTETHSFTNKIDVMFHYIGTIHDKE